MKKLVVLIAASAVLAACPKKDEPAAAAPAAAAPAPAPAPAAVKVEMKALKLTAAQGWTGEFNQATETWTWEKYTPGKDGPNEPNRFYVDQFPEDRPAEVEAYADKLQKDKDFQDMGSLFISVTAKDKLPNGWLITGVQKDMGDAADKGAPAFVLLRSDLNVYCRGGVFKSEATRTEAIDACKQLKP